jgi:hypothetical protein
VQNRDRKNIKKNQEFGLINAVAARLRKLARKGPTILWSHESEMAAECRRSDATHFESKTEKPSPLLPHRSPARRTQRSFVRSFPNPIAAAPRPTV